MRIGKLTNKVSCEYDMQREMGLWLSIRAIKYKPELLIKEVGRRADFLLKKSSYLINIEAKCNDLSCLIDQLKDHSLYCNYCFAFIPDYTATPRWFKEELLINGFGLIIYNLENRVITEVLEAHSNETIDIELNKKVKERIN